MIDEASLDRFKAEAIARLRTAGSVYPWLDKPGDIIQCPPRALCKGAYYVMGFNPHGSDFDQLGSDDSGTSVQPMKLRETIDKLKIDDANPRRIWKGKLRTDINDLACVLLGEGHEDALFVTNLFPDESRSVPS